MELKKLDYEEFPGEAREWKLRGLSLGNVNLIVGKNADGKSRTLNVMNALAELVSGIRRGDLASGAFDVTFTHDEKEHHYHLEFRQGRVSRETFSIDDRQFLVRGADGTGKIWAEELGQQIRFQIPETELTCVNRRDAIQHPYFEALYQWGKTLRYYRFGTPMGKNVYGLVAEEEDYENDPVNTDLVLHVYKTGFDRFGKDFEQAILRDAQEIGYKLKGIELDRPSTVQIVNKAAGDPMVLYVQEEDIRFRTEQRMMSQGMFRALAILIHLNYAHFSGNRSCLMIDDVGEGLDFQRSFSLIKLVVRKAKEAGVQLIMSTNDRFVMNAVPLESWSVVRREGTLCQIYNYENAREIFEEFKFTGLNNFDFLATDFIGEVESPDE